MAWKRFLIATDIHGDKQDPGANAAMFKFKKQWKPHVSICLGDLFDFRPLRRKASEDERRESLSLDFEAGKRWLEEFKPAYYLRGNHCERLFDIATRSQGPIADYAQYGVTEVEKLVKSLRCKMMGYDKRSIVTLGRLHCMHGFTTGIYAARATALSFGKDIAMGHIHCPTYHTIPGYPTPRVGVSIGCLAQLDFDYNRTHLQSLAHEHGWAAGAFNDKTDDFHIWLARKVGSRWFIPTLGAL